MFNISTRTGKKLSNKELIKVMFIYNALQDGWSVKKNRQFNTFEFEKNDFFSFGNKENTKIPAQFLRRCVSEPLKVISTS